VHCELFSHTGALVAARSQYLLRFSLAVSDFGGELNNNPSLYRLYLVKSFFDERMAGRLRTSVMERNTKRVDLRG